MSIIINSKRLVALGDVAPGTIIKCDNNYCITVDPSSYLHTCNFYMVNIQTGRLIRGSSNELVKIIDDWEMTIND